MQLNADLPGSQGHWKYGNNNSNEYMHFDQYVLSNNKYNARFFREYVGFRKLF